MSKIADFIGYSSSETSKQQNFQMFNLSFQVEFIDLTRNNPSQTCLISPPKKKAVKNPGSHQFHPALGFSWNKKCASKDIKRKCGNKK